MISVSSMDKVLRSVYLDVVAKTLNDKTSAFYKKIQKNSTNVYGKEMIGTCAIGINGGFGSRDEEADLPKSGIPSVVSLKAPMRNIYGNLEITDKLLRISENGLTNAVDMLNYEVETLLAASRFNLRRMLMQDGRGVLANVNKESSSLNDVYVDDTRNFIEGMYVDLINEDDEVSVASVRVTSVFHDTKRIILDRSLTQEEINSAMCLTIAGSYEKEILGIPYLFSDDINTLYGNTKFLINAILPQKMTCTEVSADTLQSVLDKLEEKCGSEPDMIISSFDMRRKYLASARESRLNVDFMTVDTGFKSVCYSNVPIYADGFAPDKTMYFLNTDDFIMGQLGDWAWIEGTNHDILRPVHNKAAYNATLVKYCNLICTRPLGQARLILDA